MGKLTDRTVKTAKPGRHGDGDGLHLIVSEAGRRTWLLRYQLQGRRRDMGLGSYPARGLADARIAAADARKLIASGIDPIESRELARMSQKPTPTFTEIAALVIAEAQRKSTNEKVRYQWERHLGANYCGQLLERPINEITTLEVAETLKVVWHSKPEVARKLHPAIRRVFEYARVRLRDDYGIEMLRNPADWADLKALGFETPKQLSRGSHPSLPYSQAAQFVASLRSRNAVAARAFEFLILTNIRTDAVLKAKWNEIDLEHSLWIVPLANLKDRDYRNEGFRVPLSPRAVEIIREMEATRVSEFIFPGQNACQPLSNMALLTVIRRLNNSEDHKWIDPKTGRPITAHGFRATFRTWAEECVSFPHSVIEQAMGHQVGNKVERAYRRTDVLEQRRLLMEAWGKYLEERNLGNVLKFRFSIY